MQPAPPGASTCATCGGVLEETPGGGLGCMSCLLRAGIGSEEEVAKDSTPNAFEDGGRFGVYEIDRREDGSLYELGRGAMGLTYRATDTSLQRKVALKIIKIDIAERSADARERFMREARAAASLRHENIATIHQFGMRLETGQYFYAMELIEGETLEERVRRAGPLDARTTIEIARQVTSALGAAGKCGLVHRDLKPANLMLVSTDGEKAQVTNNTKLLVKIIDFGLAKAVHTQTDPKSLTHDRFVGTPAFASPEQFEHSALDVRSDIYSLGETLWFALTGKTPFAGRSVEEIHRAQKSNVLPVEQLKAAHVPHRLKSLLESMLAFEPASRPGTGELATRLQRCSPEVRSVRRTRFGLAATFLMVLGMSAVIIFLWVRIENSIPKLGTPEKSIAVLPFENLSADPENAYFADGVQDDVLTNVAKIGELKVISRSSVMQYRGQPRNVREIGKALGVSNVLEATVRRSGNKVRVNVQLIDANTDKHIWANDYDRDVTDVFAIQSDLAHNIAEALQAKLSPEEKSRITRQPTENGEAYLAFIQAHNFAGAFENPEKLKQSAQLYQRAIELDPNFALALARYSQLESWMVRTEAAASEYREKARTLAERALQLQPDLPEAHLALGFLYYYGEDNYEAALKEFEIAQQRLPNESEVYMALGAIQRRQGKWAESTANLEKAVSLNPKDTWPLQNLAMNYQMLRNFDVANKTIDRALRIDPQAISLWGIKAQLAISEKGDFSVGEKFQEKAKSFPLSGEDRVRMLAGRANLLLAERKYQEVLQLGASVPDDSVVEVSGSPSLKALKWFPIGIAHKALGDDAAARAAFLKAKSILVEQLKQYPDDPDLRVEFAKLLAWLGEKDAAIPEAQRAMDLRPESKDAFEGPQLTEQLAKVYAILGDKARAIELLDGLLNRPSEVTVQLLRVDPIWDPLRADPRFQELCKDKEPLLSAPMQITEKSIAVLPFENLSEEKANAYFAEGVQDQILTNLGRVAELRVISHTTVRQYKSGVPRNLREIGQQLGVTHILEGSVQRAGDRLRIAAQLIDARTDSQIWAETYDRTAADLFTIQSELAESIVAQLQAKLSPEQKADIEARPTQDLVAFELYLRAKQIVDSYLIAEDVRAALLSALQSLEQAIKRDPDFVSAYCYIARANDLLYFFDLDPTSDRILLAEAAVKVALRLRPDSAEAHFAMADFLFRCRRDYDGALKELAMAGPGLPNDTAFFILSGYINRRRNNWAQAERDFSTAMALDPRNPNAYNLLADTDNLQRRHLLAAQVYDRVLAAGERTPIVFFRRDAALFNGTGNLTELRQVLSKNSDMDVGGGPTSIRVMLALIDRNFAEAERVLAASPREDFQDIDYSFYYPKAWFDAMIARAKGDSARATAAFSTARTILEQRLAVKPEHARTIAVLAQVDAGLGHKELAIQEAKHAVDLMPVSIDVYDGALVLEGLAQVYTWTNEPDRAIELLQKLVAMPGYVNYARLKLHPLWNPLRGDPRFEKIVASLAPRGR